MRNRADEVKQFWPSAVEGDLQHADLGNIHYWTGEQRGRVVVRFLYKYQPEEESDIVFFLDVSPEGWVLRHISTFQTRESDLKLITNQSFRVLDELEGKYRDIIDIFMEARKSWSVF